MNKQAYQLGVALALADAGFLKHAADPGQTSLPLGPTSIPAELLAALLQQEPDTKLVEQSEAVSQPEVDHDFSFVGTSTYTPLANIGLDFRGPVDTSV